MPTVPIFDEDFEDPNEAPDWPALPDLRERLARELPNEDLGLRRLVDLPERPARLLWRRAARAA